MGRKLRNLDGQQRLTVNANWRHAIGTDADGLTRVYLAPGVSPEGQPCLDLIPGAVIRKRYAFLEDVAEDDPLREHMAALFKSMEYKALDVQGRISIPDSFKQYAGIENNVLMVGAGDCIQVTAATAEARDDEQVDFNKFRKARMALADVRKQLKKK